MPATPARGERHVHFSPEPQAADETPHRALRHRQGYQSDLDDLFTGPGRNAMAGGIFPHTQVGFLILILSLIF